MKIFITGGSGFIGYYLQQYIDKETTIYGLAEPEFRHSAGYVKGDVRDHEALTKALNGHDIVFHLAANHHDFGISRSEYMDTNEGGARALVQASLFLLNKLTPDVHIYNYADSPLRTLSPGNLLE